MGLKDQLKYLPILPVINMIFMIVGVSVWVHNMREALNQVDLALALLGPSVVATDQFRAEQAIPATSSVYMIWACILFGLSLWRRWLAAETDSAGPNYSRLQLYLLFNSLAHLGWWMIMVWIVVLISGLGAMSIMVWVGYRATQQAVANQAVMQPTYTLWLDQGWANPASVKRAQGDVIAAAMLDEGWPLATTCPSTCLNLGLYQFVEVSLSDACVCDIATLQGVAAAARAALDVVPGIFVGIWFMYIFGDLYKVSLACDWVGADREDAQEARGGGGGGVRGGSSRYAKI
ncbi:hypothetical protein HYH03_015392 [Edaphochlamys debaryana]|uniref:Uncharacterized protein n=1 Tax=Edaphochlamys debaryana TaxID=47281 RepID=A0A835XNC7_9CHLO|nr:hypothetical protein HYH03_015392 [Edaphochlamys debaryana]|eukprot:KAG2485948.1 hypothetical protein HYH03_015392 [Edaphochlamys debaryana]